MSLFKIQHNDTNYKRHARLTICSDQVPYTSNEQGCYQMFSFDLNGWPSFWPDM